jgi:hypothetical protein
MTSWAQWLRFARWSLEFLFVNTLISVMTCGLLAWAIAALVWVIVSQPKASLFKMPWQVLPITAPAAILAVGVLYACENCGPSALGRGVRQPGADFALVIILLLQLGAAAGLVYASRGIRSLAVPVQVLLLWWSVWAAFVAGMSVSGDWI